MKINSPVKFILLILILVINSKTIYPQQSKLSKNVNYISEFIASDYFKKLSKSNNDLALADTIYLRAVHITNNDYSETLLALTFAVVPYKKVPIKIPYFNIQLYYPLISADEETFLVKNKNLPAMLYFDSPQNLYGDKDKLAHFFGSAYLTVSTNLFDFGNLIGYFVEAFEEDFKVQSSIDYRDLEVNFLGKCFGNLLKKDKSILPSQILVMRTLYYFGNPL